MTRDPEPTGFAQLTAFDGTRNAAMPQDRLRAIRHGAEALREQLLDAPPVRFARSFNLLRIPYPAWFAFTGVYSQQLLKPHMVHLLARTTLVQYDDFEGRLRTLLFTPADFESGGETPYFKRLSAQTPKFLHSTIAPVYQTVLQALALCGVKPEQVDYITYDHLHTQDVRRWLGSAGTPGLLPNARLLVHQQELANVQGLLPVQAEWYCPQGLQGVPADRLVSFDGSIQLGRGVALVHTPGHTEGNHSLVYRAGDGLRVSSENGVSADSWAPLQSRHNGIRRYAQATGAEVILNGNTQESSNDQYLSMVLEKTLAGTSALHGFSNVVPSSECSPHWLFPGAPTSHLWGETRFGTVTVA
ncbi:hypothetical protein QTI51_33960 [Variovorax sp. J22G73]|jgi:hypothetical protein|uniref:hypothetical protein n=1 Tax=unclassified Variovorax TaxID=663243 RepID=UPI000D5ED867|nr:MULTISPECIES: hypothetical protein [unclassified Variovorax]MDM0009816.1 hypothetical protein [Variovorax sp. J22R203]MDM0102324.1 hypothetical protein [Variovorax sp. J22G73]